jgi:hypothetical protein
MEIIVNQTGEHRKPAKRQEQRKERRNGRRQ